MYSPCEACKSPCSKSHHQETNQTYLKINTAAAAAKSLQACPTLCDPIDGSPTGSPVPGILQARTLEWVAISFSSEGNRKVKVKSLSRVGLLATPWTAAYHPWDFPGKSTGVGCRCLLRKINTVLLKNNIPHWLFWLGAG